MNIFETYLKKIQKLITLICKVLNIEPDINMDGIVVETPPLEFNFDLSTNIALVLAKKTKQSPVKLAGSLKEIIEKSLSDFAVVEVAGPGFINFRFSNQTYQKLIFDILETNNKYGSNNKNDRYNIEFVSANPTGPMHVGHSRGAIFGDVLSNLLIFNGNTVVKEYYINDYGNQIINFAESVFYRLRGLKYKESFIKKENLYPGDYVIDIAKKILLDFPEIDLNDFKKNLIFLSKEALNHSMNLIKNDLKALGISHDNFVSEKTLVEKKLVEKSIEYLKEKKFVVEGYLDPPKGEENKNKYE
jgi:arginyl-tRNA synthetase